MANVDVAELVKKMLQASSGVLKDKWTDVKEYAEQEYKNFCDQVARIEEMKAAGQITVERAREHLDVQKASMRNVLLTVKGMGTIAVEQAINAAIGAVRDVVNAALGWSLL